MSRVLRQDREVQVCETGAQSDDFLEGAFAEKRQERIRSVDDTDHIRVELGGKVKRSLSIKKRRETNRVLEIFLQHFFIVTAGASITSNQ